MKLNIVCSALTGLQSGNKTFNLVVTAKRPGDAQFYVPRCINGFGGNINLDGTNKKVHCAVQYCCALCETCCTAELVRAVLQYCCTVRS
jgi:hypothetical protein